MDLLRDLPGAFEHNTGIYIGNLPWSSSIVLLLRRERENELHVDPLVVGDDCDQMLPDRLLTQPFILCIEIRRGDYCHEVPGTTLHIDVDVGQREGPKRLFQFL